MRVKIEHPIMRELIGAVNPVMRELIGALIKVITLHEPVAVKVEGGYVAVWQCKGCDPGSYVESDDLPDAPCRTLLAIADALGVQVPQ